MAKKTPKKIPQKIYLIHNTTRSPATKLKRMQLAGPEKSTKNLSLCGGTVRVLRGRTQPVAESVLIRWLDQFADKAKKGLLQVSHKNKVVNLESLRGAAAKAAKATEAMKSVAAKPEPAKPEPEPEKDDDGPELDNAPVTDEDLEEIENAFSDDEDEEEGEEEDDEEDDEE